MKSWRVALTRVLGWCCLLASVGTAQAAVVAGWVAPDGTSVQVGSPLRMQFALSGLTGDAASSLGLYDLDVQYDAGSLRFVGGSFAPGGSNALDLPEPGAPSFLGDFIDNGGTLDIFALSGNSQAVLDSLQSNDLLLFELQFEALAVDPAAVVALDLADPLLLFGSSDPFVTLAPGFSPASLSIAITSSGGSVPEPTSLALVLLALSVAAARPRGPAVPRQGGLSCA